MIMMTYEMHPPETICDVQHSSYTNFRMCEREWGMIPCPRKIQPEQNEKKAIHRLSIATRLYHPVSDNMENTTPHDIPFYSSDPILHCPEIAQLVVTQYVVPSDLMIAFPPVRPRLRSVVALSAASPATSRRV